MNGVVIKFDIFGIKVVFMAASPFGFDKVEKMRKGEFDVELSINSKINLDYVDVCCYMQ